MTWPVASPPGRGRAMRWGWGALMVATTVAIAWAAATAPVLAIAAAMALGTLMAALVSPETTAWVFLGSLLALSEFTAVRRYDLGIGLFGADVVPVLLFCILLHGLVRGEFHLRAPVATPLVLNSAMGLLFAFGAAQLTSHALRDVLGDFRRFYVYPLAFFIGLYLARRCDTALSRVQRLSYLAAVVIGSVAAFRLVTGVGYRPDQFNSEFRAFSFFDSTILFLPFAFLLTVALLDRRRRLAASLGVAVIAGLEIASGYRLAWGLVLTVPLLTGALVTLRTRRIRYLLAGLPAVLLALGAATFVVLVNPELLTVWRGRFDALIALLTNVELSWRFLAWNSAIQKFLQHPLVGVGIGDVHSFWILDSAGIPVMTTHTAHNAFVSVLYQTGILGFTFFVAIHIAYLILLIRAARRVPYTQLPLFAGFASFYAAAIAVSSLQPFLSSPGGAALLYLLMGLTVPSLQRWGGSTGTSYLRQPQPREREVTS